jgi:hypothetical protein
VGAVVTACQRVGIRSQVQRLSRPHRGDRRARRRRRGQRMPLEAGGNGEASGSSPTQGEASELVGLVVLDGETSAPVEAGFDANGSNGERDDVPASDATEPAVQGE